MTVITYGLFETFAAHFTIIGDKLHRRPCHSDFIFEDDIAFAWKIDSEQKWNFFLHEVYIF